ncbi:MAG: helix-turn-helix transcriptional regulator [Longimicrobiales bacterium]
MAQPIERWITRTRGRILALLRAGPRAVTDLAGEVGISDNAVRMHLSGLQRDGLVAEAGALYEGGVGKPAQRFRITVSGEEQFPKAYAAVLTEVLRAVVERDGEDGLQKLLREVGRRAAGERSMGGGRVETRIHGAVEVLRSLGAEVTVHAEEEDVWRIDGNGCPLAGVVREEKAACTVVQSLIEAVTGGKVTQCCRHGERPRCGFRIDGSSESMGIA